MPPWAWLLTNGAAGVAIVLLLLDPTRDLRPVFALLAVAVGTVVVSASSGASGKTVVPRLSIR
jgi:hypothetical protein